MADRSETLTVKIEGDSEDLSEALQTVIVDLDKVKVFAERTATAIRRIPSVITLDVSQPLAALKALQEAAIAAANALARVGGMPLPGVPVAGAPLGGPAFPPKPGAEAAGHARGVPLIDQHALPSALQAERQAELRRG